MSLGLRQADRICLGGDEADQAFVRAHDGLVDRLPVQTLGRVKFQRAVYAQDVDRAHFRHHVGSDQHHDLVKALLRADRFRHHFAETAQKHARTAKRASHGVGPLSRIATRGQHKGACVRPRATLHDLARNPGG